MKYSLNRSQLKWFAILAMTIDHIALAFLNPGTPLYFGMRLIGRITAPVMSFFLAEGFRNTRNFRNYLSRMLLFALIAQPFYFVLVNGEIIKTDPHNPDSDGDGLTDGFEMGEFVNFDNQTSQKTDKAEPTSSNKNSDTALNQAVERAVEFEQTIDYEIEDESIVYPTTAEMRPTEAVKIAQPTETVISTEPVESNPEEKPYFKDGKPYFRMISDPKLPTVFENHSNTSFPILRTIERH